MDTLLSSIVFLSITIIVSASVQPEKENAEQHSLIDYRLKPSYNKSSLPFVNRPCEATGLMCRNCYELVYCRNAPGGEWTQELEKTCGGTEVCSVDKCTATPDPSCSPWDDLPFLCSSSGMFPNPGDCKKYHFCTPHPDDPFYLTETTATCLNPAFGYNSRTTFCDKRLTNGQCYQYPIPFCKHEGFMDAVSENRVLYYQCLRHPDNDKMLYPFQSACEDGKTFYISYGCYG